MNCYDSCWQGLGASWPGGEQAASSGVRREPILSSGEGWWLRSCTTGTAAALALSVGSKRVGRMAADEQGLPTLVNPLRVPCLRQTLLHALAGGTFMGTWRFYKSRACSSGCPDHGDHITLCTWAGKHLQAANTGIKCFCFLGVTSWCAR